MPRALISGRDVKSLMCKPAARDTPHLSPCFCLINFPARSGLRCYARSARLPRCCPLALRSNFLRTQRIDEA